jgi:hypothetical protein
MRTAGVEGLRQVNGQLLEPIIASVAANPGAAALIDATDLPASCSGFKKRPLLESEWYIFWRF